MPRRHISLFIAVSSNFNISARAKIPIPVHVGLFSTLSCFFTVSSPSTLPNH